MRRVARDRRALAAVALLALLLAGAAAFAIFRETLRAPIRVETGRFDFSIRNATVVDNEPKEPDIAKCEAKIAGDRKSVNITISNAYPLYNCTVTVIMQNVGTIPGRFEVKNLIGEPAGWLNVTYEDPREGVMIGVNQSATAKIFIRVRDKDVPEGASSSFIVEYVFRQYLPYP
ncbi:MAG: hypothetical protein N3F67_05000 [Acidilobaceae archaeon]|nr:hypothetical protein [Acidilobaceae archaeon]